MTIDITTIINDIDDLVSLPDIALRVNQMIDDPNCNINTVADILSQDPAMTTRVLGLANSAMFGLRSEVDSVSKAINVIGTQRLRDLIIATSAVKSFEGIPNELISMDDFWMHSLYCGLIAKLLATKAKASNADSLFVAGLLHDIGHLVMFRRLPELSKQTLIAELEDPDEKELYLIENDMIGFDHAELGGRLAEHWGLPTILSESIKFHHQPGLAPTQLEGASTINIANSLAVLAELNTSDFEQTDAPPISPQTWNRLGLEESITAEIIEEAKSQFDGMKKLLIG